VAEFILETTYELKYDVKHKVPIDEIIESLKSVEHLLKRTPAFLELHYKGIHFVDSEVFVTSLESGSLKESYWFKMLFKTDADAEKADELIDKVLRENDVVKLIVAVGMGAVLTYGVMSALPSGSPSKHIEAYNNTIINIGADANFTADDVSVVLEGMKDKKALAKHAVSALTPTQADPNARIEMNGIEELTIPSEYFQEAPKEYEPPKPQEVSKKYDNVDVVIYASDQDNHEKGWAGIVPQLVEGRTPFILSGLLNPKDLHGKRGFKADIEITEKYNARTKQYKPFKVEINKVYPINSR